ncbi:hypothetical protein PoB_001975300 [Plakobranchus ocellatus]|uniref:Secreted protein n=1 Tax=Plakobranchus ocellatus TaxID=259542 RepID=A0AAV3ZFJ5_9GAST|nr:hypothetical protein PoB_001975300 [Plakobranchus ocellatus]
MRTARNLIRILLTFLNVATYEGNKPKKSKEDNKKFSRGGDGVGFQPTIAHHYVFHVSMGRSWRWPPVRHHIAEHASARARSPWTSHPLYDKASLASNQADQKLIHMMCIPAHNGRNHTRPKA